MTSLQTTCPANITTQDSNSPPSELATQAKSSKPTCPASIMFNSTQENNFLSELATQFTQAKSSMQTTCPVNITTQDSNPPSELATQFAQAKSSMQTICPANIFIQFFSPANAPDASQVKSAAFVLFLMIVDAPSEMDGFFFIPATFSFHISTLPKVGTRVTAVAIYYLPGAAQESAQLSSPKGPIRLLSNQAVDFWQLLESECYPDGGESSMPLLESERKF